MYPWLDIGIALFLYRFPILLGPSGNYPNTRNLLRYNRIGNVGQLSAPSKWWTSGKLTWKFAHASLKIRAGADRQDAGLPFVIELITGQ